MRHKARANELAQAQAELQTLEEQRDATQQANQRDERTLGDLKGELQKIKSSFDQIRKTNQAKLTALRAHHRRTTRPASRDVERNR